MIELADLTALVEECSESERESAYRACWIVALADGLEGERERLDEIARQLRLDNSTAQQIESNVRVGNQKCPAQKNEAARRLMFHCAIVVARADGRLTQREAQVVRRLGRHLGIPREDIERQLSDVASTTGAKKRSGSRSTRPEPVATAESEAAALGGLLGSLRSPQDRQRRYRYSSPFGWLPGARAVFFIGFGLSIFVWMVGGPSGYEWLGILPPLWLIFGGVFDAAIFFRRSFTMRYVARRLGLQFSRKTNYRWEPPPHSDPISIQRTCNRIEGEFEGERVAVFDAVVGWRSLSSGGSSSKRKGSSERYFSVVEVDAPPDTPQIIIGDWGDSRFSTVPIPGTDYYLHGSSRELRERAAAFISDELIDFLAENPKLVIQSDGDRMSVYCKRWMSTHRQTPGNLPAFLEDVLYLRSLFVRRSDHPTSGNDDGANSGFSLEEATASTTGEAGTWHRQRLWAQHRFVDPNPVRHIPMSGGTMTIRGRWNFGCLAVFGVLWTAGSAAGLSAASDSFSRTLLTIFVGVGLLLAVPGIIGLAVGFLKRPRRTLAEPDVRISGSYPPVGNELLVEFSQKNVSSERLHDVSLSLELARHISPGENSKTPVGQRPWLVEQWEMTWPKQWQSEESFEFVSVEPDGRLEAHCRFPVPPDLPAEVPDEEWWGLYVITAVDGKREYAGTMRLPATHLPNISLYIPAVVFGAMFGAFFFFQGSAALLHLLYLIFGTANPSGAYLGAMVLTPLAFIGGGYAGYRLAKKSPDLPVLSGVHRGMKRVHPFISVLATLAAVPLLIGGYILGMIMKWEAERLAREDQQAHITATDGTAESGPGTNAGNVSSGQPNQAGESPTGQPNDPLQNLSVEDRFRRAVRRGTPDEVRAILKTHPDKQLTSMKVSGDGTALHLAAFHGRPGVAAVLIEFGANVNARGASNRTPLHMACQMNRVLAVRVLLENEADTSLKDAAGYTARSLAAGFKRTAVLRILDEHDSSQ